MGLHEGQANTSTTSQSMAIAYSIAARSSGE
jgi:hypothetical protein